MEFKAFRILLVFMCSARVCFARKNVLFLMVDDLRPQIEPYSGEHFPSSVSPPMITSNLTALASKSLLLQRAYVQQAVCTPSRASLLTGRRPETTRVHKLETYFRDVGGNFTTIPQHFKQNGYTSVGIGKIFHPGVASGYDDPLSWSEPYFHGVLNHEGKTRMWRAVPENDLKSKPLRDRQITDKAIRKLRDLAPNVLSGDNNFFLAVGFHKPHEPFVFPESFLDYYPEELINLPSNRYAPRKMPEVAWSKFSGLREYGDMAAANASGEIGTTLPDSLVKELRRAYYCAVTWIDSLVGEILIELETLGLSDNTIISFIGDHGYHLGEHGEWGKRNNFELSTHAPMMIRIPGLTDAGVQSDQLVEFVDLFPTIVEAAGLDTVLQCPEDSSDIELCHEGMSMLPLIENPKVPIKTASFSQAKSPYPGYGRYMGYTMRTVRYRYTEWPIFRDDPYYITRWDATLAGVELYDHDDDPDENFNRAHDKAYQCIREDLSKRLRSGWRNAVVVQPE
ncbi:iduronate 2-sulfatase-like [Mercenaria mercenaria]|uniref:iduronate 2-sulfatase-like n=1 Tax=Mercenaria mercenaria TaxID=6596 RepID=UPI00234E617C|nr:iduronate 2-sulfatase-like [Mercenaria mercenaria]